MARATTRGRKRVTFKLDAEPGSTISVAGSFNDWQDGKKKLVDKQGDGRFSATVLLHPGEYQYKFVVNGEWCVDPGNGDWVANDLGSLNSVVHVG